MSAVVVPQPVDDDDARSALQEYRSERRRKRISNVDAFDAFYKAYVGAGVGGLLTYAAAGWLGDDALSIAALRELRLEGPHYLGVLVALLTVVAIRSGVRGGPLAFEHAEVRHILMAPVDRRDTMGAPARTHLRHAAFTGMVVGAAIGLVASRRLPHSPFVWMAAGAVAGALVGAFVSSVAMAVAGARLRRSIGDLLAVPLLAWALADAYLQVPISPFSWFGSIAVLPLTVEWPAAAAVLVTALVVGAGLSLVSLSSVEAAERRSRLIGQLKFAATVQDVRTVMVLQRQLSQEHPRNRPLFRLPGVRRPIDRKGRTATAVMTRRCWHNLMRWPFFRFLRILVLSAMASACVVGVWAGTGALIVPAGLLLWLIAIDLLEPLAQEADHPSILRSTPRDTGHVMVRLLIVPALLLVLLSALFMGPLLIDASVGAQTVWLPIVISVTVLTIGGAAMVVTRGATPNKAEMQTPEVVGILSLWHSFMPPLLAIAGLVPLVVARTAYMETGSVEVMQQRMNLFWYGVLACGTWAIAWVRYGGEIKANLATATERNQQLIAEKDAAAREAKTAPAKAATPAKKSNKKGKK